MIDYEAAWIVYHDELDEPLVKAGVAHPDISKCIDAALGDRVLYEVGSLRGGFKKQAMDAGKLQDLIATRLLVQVYPEPAK